MLKAVLIDIFPFIISLDDLNQATWRSVLKEEEIQFLTTNEQFSHWLNEDLSLAEVSEKFFTDMDKTQGRANEIVKTFKANKLEVVNNYFKNFKFNDHWKKFFDDATTAECVIVLNNNLEPAFEKQVHTLKLPKGVTTADKFGLTSMETFIDELSAKNIGFNEFLIVTDDQSRIDTLIQKGCFCVTISNNDIQDESVHHINSIKDLDFGNLAFNFYGTDGGDDTGGL